MCFWHSVVDFVNSIEPFSTSIYWSENTESIYMGRSYFKSTTPAERGRKYTFLTDLLFWPRVDFMSLQLQGLLIWQVVTTHIDSFGEKLVACSISHVKSTIPPHFSLPKSAFLVCQFWSALPESLRLSLSTLKNDRVKVIARSLYPWVLHGCCETIILTLANLNGIGWDCTLQLFGSMCPPWESCISIAQLLLMLFM